MFWFRQLKMKLPLQEKGKVKFKSSEFYVQSIKLWPEKFIEMSSVVSNHHIFNQKQVSRTIENYIKFKKISNVKKFVCLENHQSTKLYVMILWKFAHSHMILTFI